jgi:hypothetical protein
MGTLVTTFIMVTLLTLATMIVFVTMVTMFTMADTPYGTQPPGWAELHSRLRNVRLGWFGLG